MRGCDEPGGVITSEHLQVVLGGGYRYTYCRVEPLRYSYVLLRASQQLAAGEAMRGLSCWCLLLLLLVDQQQQQEDSWQESLV